MFVSSDRSVDQMKYMKDYKMVSTPFRSTG